jgi:hypothetical protein
MAASNSKAGEIHAASKVRSGEIHAGSIYTLKAIDQHLGLGKAALRKARREGLVVRRVGRKSFILGEDLIAWVKRSAPTV